MWQVETNDIRYTWDEAFEYAKSLNDQKYGGYDDWRVPSIEELLSIVDYEKYDPAVLEIFTGLDSTYSGFYWSSFPNVSDSSNALSVNFKLGYSHNYDKSYKFYVRCVRAGQCDTLTIRFKKSLDNKVVNDLKTKLMWQVETNDIEYTWDEALEYAKSLNDQKYGGYDDWRVPRIEELLSIVDYEKYDPAVLEKFTGLDSTYSGFYWSSSPSVSNSSNAWLVDVNFGDSYYFPKSTKYYVRCVRAGQCDTLTIRFKII